MIEFAPKRAALLLSAPAPHSEELRRIEMDAAPADVFAAAIIGRVICGACNWAGRCLHLSREAELNRNHLTSHVSRLKQISARRAELKA
jgi:hypothetical protein